MKIIVGLGNPGFIYANSRHNIGFSVIKAIAKIYKISLKKERGNILYIRGHKNRKPLRLRMEPEGSVFRSGKPWALARVASLGAKVNFSRQNVILAMPLTFMNLSGLAVMALIKKYKIGLEDLLVVCDDLDLEFGRIKIRPSGSSGGHRGLESIIDAVGSRSFSRLRIGVGRPGKQTEASDYVLSAFTKKEKAQVSRIIERTISCCQSWATKGTTETMSIFNVRSEYYE